MKNKQKISSRTLRHFIWRSLTVLMFFYLCADVSVLEYFCGNPSLAIASYRQVVKTNPQPIKSSEIDLTWNTIDYSHSSKHNHEPEIPFDGDDCFCCSSHAVITYDYLIVSLLPVVHQHYAPVFSNRQSLSNRHLLPFYRPPRLA